MFATGLSVNDLGRILFEKGSLTECHDRKNPTEFTRGRYSFSAKKTKMADLIPGGVLNA